MKRTAAALGVESSQNPPGRPPKRAREKRTVGGQQDMADDASPDDPLNIALPTPVPASPRTGWFLMAFYALAVVWGVRNVWSSEPSGLDFLIPVMLAICLGWWAMVDARQRKRPIPRLSKPWFFLFAGLIVPGYIISSRGWRGLGWVVLHAVCWYALATAAMYAAGTIVFGAEWWRAM